MGRYFMLIQELVLSLVYQAKYWSIALLRRSTMHFVLQRGIL